MGRDRADRGLERARARARAESIATLTRESEERARSDAERQTRLSHPPLDLAHWRTQSEIEHLADQIQATRRLASEARMEVAVPDGTALARSNEADVAAAQHAMAQAQDWRAQSTQAKASRPELVAAAKADYRDARDAAVLIVAGPGLFGRRGARLAVAEARWAEVAKRWQPGPNPYLPGPNWSDHQVEVAATTWVARIVEARIDELDNQARRAEREAHLAEARSQRRVDERERAIEANRQVAQRQQALGSSIERLEAEHTEAATQRAEALAHMSPAQVIEADRARTIYVLQQRSLERSARGREAWPRAPHRSGPGRGHDGPSLGRGIEM
ncbi:MAG: hypothetical protein ACRDWV_02275 [Acidimicrobiales bacterium]